MSNFFTWERFDAAVPQILSYLGLSFQFVIICLVAVTVLSVVYALLRMKKTPVLKQFLNVYISYMRGAPLLVQMMVVYYGLPFVLESLFGIDINSWAPIVFAEIAVILNESAFLGEIVKATIQSIPNVQYEAAYSIGMTKEMAFRRIILPQAVRILVPTYGQTIALIFQDTSLIYMVGVTDMMSRAKSIGAMTGHSLEAFVVVALVYIAFSLLVKFGFGILERRMTYGRAQ